MSYYYTIPSTRSSGCSRRCSRNKAGSRRAAYPYGYGHGYIGDISNFASSVMSDNTCKVIEDDTKYEVLLDVPGVKAKDIKVQLEENGTVISIKAQRKSRDDEEMVEHEIEKRLSLASNVDQGRVTANVEDGVLLVTLKKLDQIDAIKDIPVTEVVNADADQDDKNDVSVEKNDADWVGVTGGTDATNE
mmetsp:Transcript_15267/g.22539  ORF Transcript_15267/g.22539 Transcript_15267/m.22539 type:complete len:189 (-) Transcript_15267:104-670(-)